MTLFLVLENSRILAFKNARHWIILYVHWNLKCFNKYFNFLAGMEHQYSFAWIEIKPYIWRWTTSIFLFEKQCKIQPSYNYPGTEFWGCTNQEWNLDPLASNQRGVTAVVRVISVNLEPRLYLTYHLLISHLDFFSWIFNYVLHWFFGLTFFFFFASCRDKSIIF